MKGKRVNSKQKGNRGEREWAKICREHGYEDCKRSQQYCGGTTESADVTGLPYIYQEVKFGYAGTVEEIRGFLRQATNDMMNSEKRSIYFPIVAHKKTYGKWFVTMGCIDFNHLFNKAYTIGGKDLMYTDAPKELYVTLPVEDWFEIYREFESTMAIQSKKEGA